MITLQRKRSGLTIPLDGEILWNGIASAVPAGWALDTAMYDTFLMGCASGEATSTVSGVTSHTHTNPSTTNAVANHTHGLSGSTTNSGATVTVRDDPRHDNVQKNHAHTLSGTSGAGGGHSHTLSGTGSTTHLPSYRRLYWIKATKNIGVPIGGIIMWKGTAATIPKNFFVCNGSNGTPDMRNRFVYGASADAQVSTAGGATTHTHTNSAPGSIGTHTHTLAPTVSAGAYHQVIPVYNKYCAKHGHSHTVSTTSNSGGGHSHTLGSTGSANNLPVYLKLYYIMRGA